MTNAESTTTTSNAPVAEQGAPLAPAKPSSKKGASPTKGAPKAKKTAKAAKPKKEANPAKKAPKPAAERSNNKAEVIAMMKRAKGVTLAEIRTPPDGRNTPSGASSAPRQQGRRDDRVLEERCRRENVQNREVARPLPTTPPLATSPGRRFCLWRNVPNE